jgi:hypothetical protein
MTKPGNKLNLVLIVAALLAAAWILGGNFAPPNVAHRPATSALTSPAEEGVSTAADGALSSPGTLNNTAGASVAAADPIISPVTGGETIDQSVAPDRATVPAANEPPEAAVSDDGAFTVSLTVRCDTVLDHLNWLDPDKHELLPADGVILSVASVTAYAGESVFNILQRELKQAKIHLEFMNTPLYNSAYIEGIQNLYEFDAGELSGWIYQVNGSYPAYGCSRYPVQAGDRIEWVYTCDLGRDLGAAAIGSARGGAGGDE